MTENDEISKLNVDKKYATNEVVESKSDQSEDNVGSDLICSSEENSLRIGENIAEDDSGVTEEVKIMRDDFNVDENKEEVASEEGVETEGDDKSIMASKRSSAVEIKSSGDCVIRSDLPQDEAEPEVDSVLPETESDYDENKSDTLPADSCEKTVEGSRIENASIFQPAMVLMESKSENPDEESNLSQSALENEEDGNVTQSETVMTEPESVNKARESVDCAANDPEMNKNSIEEGKETQSELMEMDAEEGHEGATDSASSDPRICKDDIEGMVSQSESIVFESQTENSRIAAAEVAENGDQIDVIKDKAETILEHHNDPTEEAVGIPESGLFEIESSPMPSVAEEPLKDKLIVEEEGGDEEYIVVTEKLPVEALVSQTSLSSNQEQKNQQNNEKLHASNETTSESEQENHSEFLVTEFSSFDSSNLMSEPDLPIEKSKQVVSENKINATKQCASRQSMERLSTKSNPNNSSIQPQMQKSPSFSLDLRTEARTEDQDKISLLYQDKTALEELSPQAYINQNDQEEKVVRIESNGSDKLKSPFIGFLKEEEEARLLITSHIQENNNCANKENKVVVKLSTNEVISSSPKSKEKRKAKASLFTNCMCCTTVMN